MNPKTSAQAPDHDHSKPAERGDDRRSRMSERRDEGRKQSPAGKPGKKQVEGEPSVG